MRSVYLFLIFISLIFRASGETVIVFNERCISAQDKLYTLQLKSATELLHQEQKANPDNLTTNYLLVIHDLLKVLVSESPESFTQFNTQVSTAIKLLNAYNGSDKYADFFREEIHFYASVVHAKSGNAVSAANEIRLCYKYGEKLIKDHPDFLPAYKTIGLIHAGFGNLPTSYRRLVSMLGYSGTTDKGIEELTKFTESTLVKPEWAWLKKEAGYYLASVHLYLKNDQAKAWKMVESLSADYTNNPLMIFIRANIAEKCKKNDELISVLKKAPLDQKFEPVPYFDFMLGTAKLQRLDNDAAIPLLRFLTTTKGKSYVKSCYQKLAWNALINGDKALYVSYMRKVSLNGDTNLEEDQQAQLETSPQFQPDARLLKARLLFDGGYYTAALQGIQSFKTSDFSTDLLKTEYCYRKARIYHQLKQPELAEVFYKAAILTGADLTVYYASYAALYLAELYENQGDKVQAKAYFQKATTFKNNKEYRNSIEHRSKSGLQRLR